MTKSKNHTIHNQSPKWHRNGIKKYGLQRYESPKEFEDTCLQYISMLGSTIKLKTSYSTPFSIYTTV
uniref:60S ribosomal protein L29 n=1 Tax=Urocitellus parryii TaxID=9999 RepID=A0A8D2KCV4_UROPR